jgi:hypothetical protein
LTTVASLETVPLVPRLLKCVALLLATLWLPATVHCQLENLGFDAFFGCADSGSAADHAAGGPCDDESCQTIETGQFTFDKSRIDAAALTFACLSPFCLFEIPAQSPAPEPAPLCQEETLPLLRTWQFDRRAALPARAPDSLNV